MTQTPEPAGPSEDPLPALQRRPRSAARADGDAVSPAPGSELSETDAELLRRLLSDLR